ncbi:hypothetical protein D9M71_378250 [compost metagenome]
MWGGVSGPVRLSSWNSFSSKPGRHARSNSHPTTLQAVFRSRSIGAALGCEGNRTDQTCQSSVWISLHFICARSSRGQSSSCDKAIRAWSLLPWKVH